MKSRRVPVLAATVGLWLTHTVPVLADPPGPPSPLTLQPGQPIQTAAVPLNQELANIIAGQLRQSGNLRHYNVDIRVEGGAVELTGQVADQTQREEVLRIVQGVPGVERVRDRLDVAATSVAPVSAATQFVVPEPRPLPAKEGDGFAPPQAGSAAPEPMPIFRAPPMVGGIGGPGVGSPPPPMPPYAWPTYAPYNNVSRVGYPTLYPEQAFPFIGPFYPFPKVPLGWRSVQLKWENGHWWYGRTATAHDYWTVRFW